MTSILTSSILLHQEYVFNYTNKETVLYLFVVFSILDQQQKQSIPFQGGQLMGEYDGKLYVTSRSDIYALTPVAIEKQVCMKIYIYHKLSVAWFSWHHKKS